MKHMTKIALWFVLAAAVVLAQDSSQRVSKLGTVKSLSGSVLTLKADSGAEVSISVPDGIRIVRLAPGQTDLKSAAPMQLQEVQTGDRMLVRGAPGDKPDSLVASSIVVMKQGDVAQKQQQDLQDWQKRGAGGIVTAIDAATGVLTVSVTPTISVMMKTTPATSYLRYAPNSVKFSDAVKGNFNDIKMGDQLRARGSRSADGKELTAVEIISGSFRNIAGTVSSLDASSGTVTVKDILAKKTVVVKLTPESQIRKLPAQMAQRIAFFLKAPAGANPGGANGNGGASANGSSSGGSATAGPAAPGGPGANGGFRQGGGGPPDFQQMISRLPAVTLADLQKDDAVMIVATPGTSGNEVTAITLLGGVEPILTASPNGAAALLSGWNLSSPGGEGGGPQ
ncbi:MAG TPA: hypothetical protein VFK06_00275 [Candidatus Angelobacter sp.]|nr:hypothetical protein [Candidatus Angelobacter sp.]